MVEISLSGSGEGLGREIARGYSTAFWGLRTSLKAPNAPESRSSVTTGGTARLVRVNSTPAVPADRARTAYLHWLSIRRGGRVTPSLRAIRAAWSWAECPDSTDSQNLAADTYVALTLAARATQRLMIGPGVTNPLTRHAAVTAGAIAARGDPRARCEPL